MAIIKSFTDISQSKTLSKILPLESADMSYAFNFNSGIYEISTTLYKSWVVPKYAQPDNGFGQVIPCWSLAALLEQLPYELCDDDGNSTYLSLNKDDDEYQLIYSDRYGYFDDIETEPYDDFVDACVEMIIKLKELNLL